MNSIRFLPDDLKSQIAAGEVVERPASVVKELVENSLDARATRIDVSVVGGGITLIEVLDDGVGIPAKEAPLALGRHATSKLQTFDDLETLGSYGFRGEALPSVASVSRLSIRTRCRNEDAGTLLVAEGTIDAKGALVAAPVGTLLCVKDLFFNVPARRKFLRSSNTESGHVTEVVVDAALGRPDVAFTLTRDGRQTKNFVRAPSRTERVAAVFAEEELIACRGERGPVSVEAHLSPADRGRRGAGGLKVFVNGRPVRDRAIAGAVAHAYGEALERGRYPRGVVYLDIVGRLVDVNVHPQKAEVRFAEPRAVCDAVHSVVKRGLLQASGRIGEPERARTSQTASEPERLESSRTLAINAPPVRLPSGSHAVSASVSGVAHAQARRSVAQRKSKDAVVFEPTAQVPQWVRSPSPETAGRESTPSQVSSPFRNLRLLGQLRQTYLVCESDDGLVILDQHAVHERILLSELMMSYESSQVTSQALLFPVMVSLDRGQTELVNRHEGLIGRLGLDVRARGEGTVSIHSVPRVLGRSGPEAFLTDICRALSQNRTERADVHAILGRLACSEALKPGERLQREAGESLLRSLSRANFELLSPHPDIIVAETNARDLERRAGRQP